MSDLALITAAAFGLALTAGAILRDTRHRLAAFRMPAPLTRSTAGER